MTDALLNPEESELSALVEHFLKVNGHRSSDIPVFNAAISMMTSLKISADQLKLSLEVGSDSAEALVKSLVSK
jgi:hypothetical protein